MPTKIDAHPSVIIAYCPPLDKLLFSVYDDGYPKPAYRGSANNIGGNPEATDTGPESLLIREIAEEFDPNHPDKKQYVGEVQWADAADIRRIRGGLLGDIRPAQDFFVRQDEIIEGGNKPYTCLYSVFHAVLPREVIEIAERNIAEGKHLMTEGNAGVFTLEQLTNSPRGEFSTAHATPHSLNHVFEGAKIPHPKQITAEPIGLPKRTYADYVAAGFEYSAEKLREASNAED